MIQKLPITGLALCCALAAAGIQQSQENLYLWDSKDDFKLYADRKVSGWSYSADTGFSFDLRGKPVVGISRAQSLKFSSARAVGAAKEFGDKSLKLVSARLTDDVVVIIEGETEDGKSVSKIETQVLEFKEDKTATITFPGKFIFENKLIGDEPVKPVSVPGELNDESKPTAKKYVRTVTMAGSSGTFELLPLEQASNTTDPILSVNINGSVQVVMLTDYLDPEMTDVRYTITGDHLSYSKETRILRIEGGVTIFWTRLKPGAKPYSITTTNEAIEADLDEDWNVLYVRLPGPGTAKLSGGGRR